MSQARPRDATAHATGETRAAMEISLHLHGGPLPFPKTHHLPPIVIQPLPRGSAIPGAPGAFFLLLELVASEAWKAHTCQNVALGRGQSSPIPDRIIRPSQPKPPPENPTPVQILLIPAPPKCRARDMRPLWRDLILKVWGADPLLCPCCKGTMKVTGTMIRREEIEKRRRPVGVLDRNPRSG